MSKLYLVFGEDSFLVQKNIQKIKKTTPESDFIVIDYNDTSLSSVLEEINTPSFFSDNKCISIINSTFLTSESSLEKDEVKLFLNMLENLSDNIVIFSFNKKSADNRKKYVGKIKEVAKVIDLSSGEYDNKEKFIRNIFQKKNIDVDNQIVKIIADNAVDYGMIYQEISKVMIYSMGKNNLKFKDVENLLYINNQDNIFNLTDAIMKKDHKQSILVYRHLLDQREEPVRIIISVANQIRLLLRVKILGETLKTEKDIASALAIHPYRVKLANQFQRNFTKDELKNKLSELCDLDLKIKTGVSNTNTHFELFLLN